MYNPDSTSPHPVSTSPPPLDLPSPLMPLTTQPDTAPTFTIIRSLYAKRVKQPIENPTTGQLSIIGQILKQLGQPTMGKHGKPAYVLHQIPNLNPHAAHPFTRQVNGKLVQTDLASSIMSLPPENEHRIRELLAAHNITIAFIE